MSDYDKLYKKEREEQLMLWREMVEGLFGKTPASSIRINDRDKIVEILTTIGKSKALNHMFIPSGGGLDLSSARLSEEQGKLELIWNGSAIMVNPDSLTFYRIEDDLDWWYFRLNTLPFERSGVYEDENEEENVFELSNEQKIEEVVNYYGEEVLEVEAGQYVARSFWDIGHLGYDEDGKPIPLPKHARVIIRKFNGGDFVIFSKYSLYNQESSTYDGRHAVVNGDEFHQYCVDIVEKLKERKNEQ